MLRVWCLSVCRLVAWLFSALLDLAVTHSSTAIASPSGPVRPSPASPLDPSTADFCAHLRVGTCFGAESAQKAFLGIRLAVHTGSQGRHTSGRTERDEATGRAQRMQSVDEMGNGVVVGQQHTSTLGNRSIHTTHDKTSSSRSRSARDTRIDSLGRDLVASLGRCHCHVLQVALQGVNDGGRNSSGKRDGNDGRGAKERHESAPTDSKGRGDRTCRCSCCEER